MVFSLPKEGTAVMPKALFILFLLCLMLCSICNPVRGESTKKESSAKTSSMSYEDLLTAFKNIREGMGQQEVRKLLGVPDRVEGRDPDQTWFDELWTYKFHKLPGYPVGNSRKALWEGKVMLLNGKVVHTRRIGWLETR